MIVQIETHNSNIIKWKREVKTQRTSINSRFFLSLVSFKRIESLKICLFYKMCLITTFYSRRRIDTFLRICSCREAGVTIVRKIKRRGISCMPVLIKTGRQFTSKEHSFRIKASISQGFFPFFDFSSEPGIKQRIPTTLNNKKT